MCNSNTKIPNKFHDEVHWKPIAINTILCNGYSTVSIHRLLAETAPGVVVLTFDGRIGGTVARLNVFDVPKLVVATVEVPSTNLGAFARIVPLNVENLAVIVDVHYFVTLNRPEDAAMTFIISVDAQRSICNVITLVDRYTDNVILQLSAWFLAKRLKS